MHPKQDERAYGCARCGHIRGATERKDRCSRCGADPARWNVAPVEDHEAEATVEPPVDGHVSAARTDAENQSHPQAMFATSPAGTEGYDVNPELKIRR